MQSPEDRKPRQVMPFGRSLPVMVDCIPNNMSGAASSAFNTTSWTMVLATRAHVLPPEHFRPTLRQVHPGATWAK